MDIFSRAHRTLRKMSNYHAWDRNRELPGGMPQLPNLTENESPVGIYVNDMSAFSDSIFFSTENIHVFRQGYWDQVAYKEVARIVMPEGKEKVFGFNLQLHAGALFWLPVTGHKADRFYDAFEMIRFLDRVVTDIRKTYSGR